MYYIQVCYWGGTLVLTTVALSTMAGLAALGQAQGVCSAADGAAGGLANTANSICGALDGFTEEANDTGHFYSGGRKF
jgi:hypothetical protein